MPVRRIKGAADDLYANNSNANHLALRQLGDFLRDIIGFKVVKKFARADSARLPNENPAIPLAESQVLADGN